MRTPDRNSAIRRFAWLGICLLVVGGGLLSAAALNSSHPDAWSAPATTSRQRSISSRSILPVELQPEQQSATAKQQSYRAAAPIAIATEAQAPQVPRIDMIGARIQVSPANSPDWLLSGLSYLTHEGHQVTAQRIVPGVILESESGVIRKARWEVALGDETGGLLSVVAMQEDEGILSVVARVQQSSDVEVIGLCAPAQSDEHLFGLGMRFDAFDLTGHVLEGDPTESAGLRKTYAPSTFLLSSRGYGLYVETMRDATFDLRDKKRGCYQITKPGAELRFYLFAGPTPRDVVARYAQWIGLPPLPPEWSLGVWKNLIGGQERVLGDIQKLREADVPIDAVWIYDAVIPEAGFGWPWQIYGSIAPGAYDDLPALVAELGQMDLKVLGYLNPFIYPDWQGYDEARQKGYLVRNSQGDPYLEEWTFGQRAYLDFTNPEAVQWWQARVGYGLAEIGLDGAMLDFGEDAPADGIYSTGQSGGSVDNMYPKLYHRAAFEAGQAVKPGDFAFLARSGYNGTQPYTTGRFTGDQVRDWSTERGIASVMPGVLNGSLSGWPYWGPDIAGFFQAEPALSHAAEKELWIRWVQLGALMPTMRDMYGGLADGSIDIWTDEETLAVFRTYAQMHTTLKPYLYSYAQIAHEEGLPIVRPLFLNYPAEVETYELEDEYLLGDDILVAPILKQGQTERQVYLPTGKWRNYWTGQLHEGPGWITVSAPPLQIPLFLRDGSDVGLSAPKN